MYTLAIVVLHQLPNVVVCWHIAFDFLNSHILSPCKTQESTVIPAAAFYCGNSLRNAHKEWKWKVMGTFFVLGNCLKINNKRRPFTIL